MSEIDNKQITLDFIKELTALSIKYNRWIGGCGCCGSPSVQPLDRELELPEYDYDDMGEDGDVDMLSVKWKD